MGESQDPQGLQGLLEELPLLAWRGCWPVGEESVVGEGLQEEVSCRGNEWRPRSRLNCGVRLTSWLPQRSPQMRHFPTGNLCLLLCEMSEDPFLTGSVEGLGVQWVLSTY